MIIIWKKYKQSTRATFMSAMGATAIGCGLIFTPLTVLVVADLGFHSAAWAFLGLQAAFFLIGVPLMLFAPKQAKRDTDKRIVEDVEYARYLVQINPELKEYVRNLQPAYYEDPTRPIKNYDKSAESRQVPLWRKVLGAIMAIVLLLVVIYILRI